MTILGAEIRELKMSNEGVSARDDASQGKLELTVVPLGRGEDQVDQEIRKSVDH